ncbi:hypothetical protein AWENTII_008206 [Aspergillus wentii]|nr:hypothetical protein MW887_002519 [Aspergillus wentii]
MSITDPFTLILGISAIFILYVVVNRPKVDPREPPLIKPKIPIIGHLLGVIQHGMPYYAATYANNPQPAFTLDLLFSKSYVINTPSLVAAVQRNSKIISMDPFMTFAAKAMAGVTGPGLKLLQEKDSGGGGLNQDVVHAMSPSLLGAGLDPMNRTMIRNLIGFIDDLKNRGSTQFDLHGWCQHAITIASMDSVYGPLNPYRLEEIEEALWDYESNLGGLILNIIPQITTRKAWKAREKIVAAFVNYYNADGQKDASEMTHGRWKTQHDAGAKTEDIARLEAATGIAITSNTTPATFRMLFEVYSRPELLESLREEILTKAVRIEGNVYTIDLAAIRDNCALLLSTYQEILRLRSNATPTRQVKSDILLANTYHLKAGSVLQMPTQSVNCEHGNGPQPDFNPRRYLAKDEQKLRSTGNLFFGTSPNMCPGRHFATGEILAMAAMMFLRYDISSVTGWKEPKLNTRALAASILPLDEEFPVTVTVRTEFEGVEWRFDVTEGKGKYALVTG